MTTLLQSIYLRIMEQRILKYVRNKAIKISQSKRINNNKKLKTGKNKHNMNKKYKKKKDIHKQNKHTSSEVEPNVPMNTQQK
jgi:hypothetical protein